VDSLQFIMDLKDRLTGPASAMGKSLSGLEVKLRSVTGSALNKVDQGISNTASRIKEFGRSGVSSAGKALVGFGATAAASLAAAGGAVGVFAFKHATAAEQTQGALRRLIGDKKQADAALAAAKGLSNLFGSDPREAESQLAKLVGKGYDLATALKVIQGAADLKALGAEGEKLIEVFDEIAAKGKIEGESAAQIAKAGVDPVRLRAELLGKLQNVTGNASKDIENAIQNGTIKAADLQGAALRVITQMTGKSLGGAAKDASQTLGGLVDQLKTVPDRLFDAANTNGAIDPLRKNLASLVGALNPDSTTGKQLVAAIGQVSGAIGKLLGRIAPEDIVKVVSALGDGLGFIADVLDGAVGAVSGFIDEFKIGLTAITGPMGKFGGGAITLSGVISALSTTLRVAGAVIGVTLGLIVQVASWIVQAVSGIASGLSGFVTWWETLWRKTIPNAVLDLVTWFGAAYDSFKAWGGSIVDGLWQGIKDAWAALKGGWNKLLEGLPQAVQDKLKIASPSKVMMQLGGYTVAGFTKGINDNAGNAQSALSAAVAPSMAKSVSSSTTKVGGNTYQINIHANGSDARSIADEVRKVLREELGAVAVEIGAVAA